MDQFRLDNTEGYSEADLETLNAARKELIKYIPFVLENDSISQHLDDTLHNAWRAENNTVDALIDRVLKSK